MDSLIFTSTVQSMPGGGNYAREPDSLFQIASDTDVATMERVLLIIYSCITLLGLLLFTRLFTFHVNQLQFAPSSTVVKSGPRVRHFCRLLHLENGTQNKCKECLAAYESLGRVNRSTAVGSFATHILCPECRERIRLPDRDPHIHLSVKTAKVFHRTRLSLLFFTWMQTVDPDQVMNCYFPPYFTIGTAHFEQFKRYNKLYGSNIWFQLQQNAGKFVQLAISAMLSFSRILYEFRCWTSRG